jgi:hypothetical protein
MMCQITCHDHVVGNKRIVIEELRRPTVMTYRTVGKVRDQLCQGDGS